MLLSQSQVVDLASPLGGMRKMVEEFFKDPKNQKKYQEWYLKKYGCKPKEV